MILAKKEVLISFSDKDSVELALTYNGFAYKN